MTKYCLKPTIVIDLFENEFTMIYWESGLTVSGNKHSYKVFEIMKYPAGMEEIIESLKKQYRVSQHHRIEKSVPKIINWALERNLLSIEYAEGNETNGKLDSNYQTMD